MHDNSVIKFCSVVSYYLKFVNVDVSRGFYLLLSIDVFIRISETQRDTRVQNKEVKNYGISNIAGVQGVLISGLMLAPVGVN